MFRFTPGCCCFTGSGSGSGSSGSGSGSSGSASGSLTGSASGSSGSGSESGSGSLSGSSGSGSSGSSGSVIGTVFFLCCSRAIKRILILTITAKTPGETRVYIGQQIELVYDPDSLPFPSWYGVGEVVGANPFGADFRLVCPEEETPDGISVESVELGFTDNPNPDPSCDPFLLLFSENTNVPDGTIGYEVTEAVG